MRTRHSLRYAGGGRIAALCCAAAAGLSCPSALAAGAPASQGMDAPVVSTAAGAVRGTAAAGVASFRGIPYAAAPVGPRRWRAPQPAGRWSGIRSATAFAPSCPQPASPYSPTRSSEDCLYLNVYTPARDRHPAPVLVWIHGGGWTIGEGADYDPSKLARAGTVVVTINYRLGALGFLAHPALAAHPGGSAGNYGLMDQQAALRWVKHNIGRFGGDAHNVTIAGQSAGGLSVLAQLASPRAHGLFQRAIVESGSFAPRQQSLATAESQGQAFAAAAGCPDQSAACLRALPVSALLTHEAPSATPGVVDGEVLRESVGSALAGGRFNRVPLVDGINHEEERLFIALGASVNNGASIALPGPIDAGNYQQVIATTFSVSDATAQRIAAEYPLEAYASAAHAYSALDSDANFACPALALDRSASRYVPTFAYEFDDDAAPERYVPAKLGPPLAATHQSELQYIFDLPLTPLAGRLTVAQQTLAASIRHEWASFAARGLPAAPWPRFTAGGQRMLSLVAPRPRVDGSFAADHHCGFWAGIGSGADSAAATSDRAAR